MPDAIARELKRRLDAHLANWLGLWPPQHPIEVATSPLRDEPGWDGALRPFVGVSCPEGTVLSFPQGLLGRARELVAHEGDLENLAPSLGALLGQPGARLGRAVFRGCSELSDLEDLGEWVAADDERLPEWLAPFNGPVLVVFDDEGKYAAGVGRKRHDQYCQEIAVGTEEAHRGKGLAKRLVATAARRIYEEGAVATYLHSLDNVASAHVAEAVGFPDRGWKILGLWGERL